MSSVVATRLRRVRLHIAVAVALGPVAGIAATVTQGGWLPGLAIPALVFIVGAEYFAVTRFRPRRWPHVAMALGTAAGAYAGSATWFTALPAAALLGVLGFVVADRASKLVLQPYTPELADSPVEVPWRARGARNVELLVGTDRITLVASRGRLRTNLGGVGTVEQVMVARSATLSVPGVGDMRVTPGPAVRIAVPLGEWILPTDQGRDIARLVARRKALACPGEP